VNPVLLGLFMFILQYPLLAQTEITGKWISYDDETLEAKSVVDIFEKGSKYHGKIVRLFRKSGEDSDPVCTKCDQEDPRFNKKVIGMEILTDMIKVGNEFSEGTILDPNNGKIYKCKMWIENSDLKLRGYWGPFYRTQTWKRSE
jgi:uncharacterized protein (DUF2147 family)